MAKEPMQSVLHHIRSLVVAQEAAGLADSVLLERFLTRRDEAAFEALVRRHGPMVMGVCRRILQNPDDAEDAFQATFLVLVRKASSIAKRELLGNWLYGVAYHTARAARSAASRRRAKEAKAVARQQPQEENTCQELLPLLDHELSRLPDKYRIPVVLCELEGKSRQDAARQLGLPEGTLSSRLARARAILARRLRQRGLALTGGALAAGLSQQATASIIAPSLILSTVKAGTLMLAGQSAAAGAVSAHVAALSEGVVKTMFLAKLKIATGLLLLGSVLAIGVSETTRHVWAARTSQGAADSTHETLLAASDKSSREGSTKALLQQAQETAATITDPIARLRTLLRIASVQDKMGQTSDARKTRQEALQIAKNLADGRPKAFALWEVAGAQAASEDRSAALETLRQAEQAAAAIPDANEQSNAFLNLVIARMSLKDYEGALRTTASMKEGEILGLHWIAQSLRKESGQAGRLVLERVFQRVKSSSVSTADQPNAFVDVAAAYARMGDLKTALEIADTLGNRKDHALERIAIAQAKAGDIDGALRTATSLDPNNSKSRGSVLQAVALAQEEVGDRAAARTTLQKLRQIAENLPRHRAGRGSGVTGATILREGIVMTQVRLGDIEGALQTASAFDSVYDKAKALLEIGTAQTAAGRLADARETLFRAVCAVEDSRPDTGAGGPTGPSGSRDWAKASTLRQIAEQQAKAGDIKQALRTVESIPANRPDPIARNERDIALAGIVQAQAQAGDVKGGLETLARIKTDEDKVIALEHLVQAQVNAGDERGALALAARQSAPLLKAHALLAIASGKASQKGTKE
jgi:RNA polymerase sigma factor (sigma-70 family)